MAIYDCFQYFNEDHVLDLRFNILNEKVDYFVISESTKTHQGNTKKLNFNLNNFTKFKHKIKYVVADFEKKIDFDKDYPFWRIDKITQQIINGGWHFSFLHKPSDIALKIKSYSHGEFNKNKFVDEEKIKEKIANNEDIFDRGFELKKVTIDESYPDFIQENKSKLEDWIL